MKALVSNALGVVCVLMTVSPGIVLPWFLLRRAFRKVADETPFNGPPKRTYTFQGCGCRYNGWKHFDDGTAEATIWVTAFFLPLFPCEKHRLIVHSNPNDPDSTSVGGIPFLHVTITHHDHFEPLVELPVSGREVFHTYLFSYVLMPLWLLGPAPLLWWHFQYGEQVFKESGGRNDVPKLWGAALVLVWLLVYVGGTLGYQLDKSRGARPKPDRLIPRRNPDDDSAA